MDKEKTQGELLNERLVYKQKNAWEHSEKEVQKAFDLCEDYKTYLDKGKTEREFCSVVESQLVKSGYENLNELMKKGSKLKQGTKVYYINKQKSAVFAVIGREPLTQGINMVGAHIDSPRLDLKPNPLYEDTGMVLLKTHYYGGIKKYQWVTIPYSLHGVVFKADGTKVEVCIGEDDKDPVFTITDLLPHLAQNQMQKKATEVVEGESLNILLGSIPYKDDKVKDKIKLNILKLLNEKYGMVEEDFISAELEAVPAFKARDIGLDRSMVGAYGQDDRVCAFTCVKAMLELTQPEKTALCILTDKEEIGSMGNTGAQSNLLKSFISKLLYLTADNYSDILTNQCLENSKMLSADVNAAVDPTYTSVNEKSNSSYMGNGVVLQKYTGSRGKYDASDANAEFVSEIRNLFNKEGIIWHLSEMGKVDLGGGGTIAQHVANLGVDVLDCGVPILSMHSPMEISSKIDVYMSYRAMKVFLERK
ncbi:aminopeptidase [Ruminiclostridium cellulolyticum]|uniref:M18 family aminopeptidase n=1 Tax=Ruminiclostridium cellulolyticum (strain ATCC 35319 / DSM 5812 / JCM 6584 / H10) TaxID=394503 RepID=B8I3D1_RUMCH|nr:aminopeptidase [Ruminiclostridium cellulolyticum]ACL76274.1 peptidase M18 aminopeptidase I [Ruminiclostridium cellulolyticum H10]